MRYLRYEGKGTYLLVPRVRHLVEWVVRHIQLAKALEVAEPDGQSGEEVLPCVQVFEAGGMVGWWSGDRRWSGGSKHMNNLTRNVHRINIDFNVQIK